MMSVKQKIAEQIYLRKTAAFISPGAQKMAVGAGVIYGGFKTRHALKMHKLKKMQQSQIR